MDRTMANEKNIAKHFFFVEKVVHIACYIKNRIYIRYESLWIVES